jgi:hypothetical protein
LLLALKMAGSGMVGVRSLGLTEVVMPRETSGKVC